MTQPQAAVSRKKQRAQQRAPAFADAMLMAYLLDRVVPIQGCWCVIPDGNDNLGRRPRVWDRISGKKRIASRAMMALMLGVQYDDLPQDLVVLHSCDNLRCVSPCHLSLGTQQQNIQESWDRNRRSRQRNRRLIS